VRAPRRRAATAWEFPDPSNALPHCIDHRAAASLAALAMIAQRKPNLDKGFEELHLAMPDPAWNPGNCVSIASVYGLKRWLKPALALVFANVSRRRDALKAPPQGYPGGF
jgi:hypothetical protein